MMDERLINYLKTYILKKDEQLDLNNITEGRFIDIPIVKSTKRIFRKQGIITIGNIQTEDHEIEIDSSLKTLRLTPRKKVSLNDDHPETLKWLEEGWVLKEIRLKQDGKTLDNHYYRMGYRLFNQQQKIEQQQNEKITKEMKQLRNELLNVNFPKNQPVIEKRMVENIKEKFVTVCEIDSLRDSALFVKTWPIKKRMKFLQFIVALVRICSIKQQFDWKEVGASYYKTIGGSKVFDRNQDEFLQLFEEWSGYPAVELGLTSLGHITPVFFSGQLKGRYSSYEYGPVHSVTNLSLVEEQYTTSATTFWIVENRGILTRLASEKGFLEESSVLSLCCDGHIRSAHRQFMEQVLQNYNLRQVMIWTDYDQDGMMIAHELYKIVETGVPTIKWISPNGEVLRNWVDYEQAMKKFLMKNTMEQEEMTGDVTLWKKWIKS